MGAAQSQRQGEGRYEQRQREVAVRAAATVDLADLASDANGVFMTNVRGYVATEDRNWKETQAEAQAANVPVEVQVERAVGKVFVFPANGGNVPVEGGTAVGTATMSDFALDVTNLKTYWMRKPGESLTGNGTADAAAPTAAETGTTPHYYQYAIDPNMAATAVTEFSTAVEYPQTFSTGGWDDAKGLYVVENTMNPDAQKRNNTTRVLVRLTYLPASLQFTSADNSSWADYRGKMMTLTELKQKIQDAATQSDEQMKMPVGFAADVAQLTAEEKNFGKSFYSHNLKYYHQGQNIYATYIRHFDDTKQPKLMAYGRYGVVRNHIYKIEVTKVMGPGSPVPPTPDDNPDDNTTTYIAVKTVVLPWNTRDLETIKLN
ncbi:Mfa1 family fimbria major subunit [Prevotella dentasini]|uniref:Mfa1 family fimbria major subunit n=1 Tax=Prevotella dentasini TaxID=589537 RepID=UPI001901CBB2|nr:Mfa1 family fimbria major subunit [Prevotella dentasini]